MAITLLPVLALVTLIVIIPSQTTAQELPTLGSRAAALAAFVAVADDASAVAWNPAGLVSGPIVNIVVDLGRGVAARDEQVEASGAAGRTGTTLVAIGTTPLGLAYYRIRSTAYAAVGPADGVSPGRQDTQVSVRTLTTNHFGATVQQSVGDFLTLGATVKLVRGRVSTTNVSATSWEQAFERAEAQPAAAKFRGDVDLGVMLAVGHVRAGVVVRNFAEPGFAADGADEDGHFSLKRHARVGVAWAENWPANSSTVLSADADLTRVAHPAGERRDLAAGAERWLRGRRIGVRGGFRLSTVGAARPVVSGGGSYALRSGIYLDGHVARGQGEDRSWGLAARMSF